jgi:hypothetical protein
LRLGDESGQFPDFSYFVGIDQGPLFVVLLDSPGTRLEENLVSVT